MSCDVLRCAAAEEALLVRKFVGQCFQLIPLLVLRQYLSVRSAGLRAKALSRIGPRYITVLQRALVMHQVASCCFVHQTSQPRGTSACSGPTSAEFQLLCNFTPNHLFELCMKILLPTAGLSERLCASEGFCTQMYWFKTCTYNNAILQIHLCS